MKQRTTKHLDWEIVLDLIGKMKQDNNRLHLLVTIQAMLGMRVSDALSLTWRQLKGGEFEIVEQKTGKTRKMYVNESLRDAVKQEYKKRRVLGAKLNDKIFINKHGSRTITVGYVNKALKKVFKKYGIEAEQVSSHMFRKSFAYKILEDGDFSDKAVFTVSDMLNHSNINTTMRYLLLHDRNRVAVYDSIVLK